MSQQVGILHLAQTSLVTEGDITSMVISTIKPFPLKDKAHLAQNPQKLCELSWMTLGPWVQDTQIDLFLTPDTGRNSE